MVTFDTILAVLQALSSVFAVAVATIAFWHTYKVTKARGQQLAFPEARVLARKKDHFQLNALIQNIGDCLMYLRFESARIELPNGLVFISQQEEYEDYQFQPETQIPKGFTFCVEILEKQS